MHVVKNVRTFVSRLLILFVASVFVGVVVKFVGEILNRHRGNVVDRVHVSLGAQVGIIVIGVAVLVLAVAGREDAAGVVVVAPFLRHHRLFQDVRVDRVVRVVDVQEKRFVLRVHFLEYIIHL